MWLLNADTLAGNAARQWLLIAVSRDAGERRHFPPDLSKEGQSGREGEKSGITVCSTFFTCRQISVLLCVCKKCCLCVCKNCCAKTTVSGSQKIIVSVSIFNESVGGLSKSTLSSFKLFKSCTLCFLETVSLKAMFVMSFSSWSTVLSAWLSHHV